MEKISKIPGIGTTSLKKTVEKGKMITARAWETGLLFDHFTTNSWIYESLQVDEFLKRMTKEDAEIFFIDSREINWQQAIKSYVYGIQKFCLKQQSIFPDQKTTAMIRKNDFGYFEDVRWAFFNGNPILY